MAVHPMREGAVRRFLKNARAEETLAERLAERGLLLKTLYRGEVYYQRSLPG